MKGGYKVPHTTGYLINDQPAGQNLLCCDSHVEWRSYVASKSVGINTGPLFWLVQP